MLARSSTARRARPTWWPFNEPESRIQDRLHVLAAEGRIAESAAAPNRWMIVFTSDDDDTDS